jgi:hypothetical protein
MFISVELVAFAGFAQTETDKTPQYITNCFSLQTCPHSICSYNVRITITILHIIHRPVFYSKLNSIGLSVSHRKHITSPRRAQQVNDIYRFVTLV